jgi:hypothetical protein
VARILLIGRGPLPSTDPDQLGFPQLRTAAFQRALQDHDVTTVLLQPGGASDLHVDPLDAHALDAVIALRERVAPDVVVTAGPYEPARFGALCVGDEPLFVDVPGDPFAEAQAKAAVDASADHVAAMRQAWAPAYARGDAFGAVSASQRLALLGQLGWLGRLGDAPADHPWVQVIPVSAWFGALPSGSPRARAPGTPLQVALCGGYNTWLDGDTLLQGLHLAMDALPGLTVLSTGGAIQGHHESAYARFRTGALESAHADRFTFHGWVAHDRLPGLLRGADVGLCMDRPGLEPELGSRTRVLFYADQGLQVAATPCSDLTRELADAGLITALAPGSPESVCAALIQLTEQGRPGTVDLQSHVRRHHDLAESTRGLLAWLESGPARTRPGQVPSAALAVEIADLRRQLAAVHQSPTWRAASATSQALKRLPELFRK